jgi:hypothetical protein
VVNRRRSPRCRRSSRSVAADPGVRGKASAAARFLFMRDAVVWRVEKQKAGTGQTSGD